MTPIDWIVLALLGATCFACGYVAGHARGMLYATRKLATIFDANPLFK